MGMNGKLIQKTFGHLMVLEPAMRVNCWSAGTLNEVRDKHYCLRNAQNSLYTCLTAGYNGIGGEKLI